MISVNDLINNAYTRCGLVGDGQSVNGTKAKIAEHELRNLITMLNTQEYIADNLKVYTVSKCGRITIGNSDDFDIKIANPPSSIKSIGRKRGNRFVRLVKSNMDSIYASKGNHHATQYTYNVEYDEEKEMMVRNSVFRHDF